MWLPVCPDFCTGIFFIFAIFFFLLLVFLSVIYDFPHLFCHYFLGFFHSSYLVSHHFSSVFPVPLSLISFTISASCPRLALLFLSPLLTFPPPFPSSLFLVISSLLRKCYPHWLFSTISSPANLCKPAPPAAPTAPVNPETSQRLRGTCLPAGVKTGLALPWKLKQRGSVCQSRGIGKKTWCQSHTASFMFPQLKQPVGKVVCHCSALVRWPLWMLVSAHCTQHCFSLIDRIISVCTAECRFITAH